MTVMTFFGDDLGGMGLLDTRYSSNSGTIKNYVKEDLPEQIRGTYQEDYNICYVDDIICKKLQREKHETIPDLKKKYKKLETLSHTPQTHLERKNTLNEMEKLEKEIKLIETGEKLRIYKERVKNIISEYKRCRKSVKVIVFDEDETEENNNNEPDEEFAKRIGLIENYLEVAARYIDIDVIRTNVKSENICIGCGTSLANVATNSNGTIRCPNEDCRTEHDVLIVAKMTKDHVTSVSNPQDESIDNFLRAFNRYQGLQSERPDESLYEQLDEYFISRGLPTGREVREMELNSRGRRGDTNHAMLRKALSKTKNSGYYEDVNLIAHIYWGWELPNVMHYKDIIISHYMKTQKVFYDISPQERGRTSSLGTQFRLWRHLQLVGHECYMDEFKIAENAESLRTHNKLWKMMCEGADDPNIRYIE